MNFDFSGMLGGGFTNNLNENNFDFSAYAPQKETVTDPVDVVSNNTPDAQVDILEGAGTVAITKQPEVRYSSAVTNPIAPTTLDPIEQAIQSVQPKPIDLGMDFGIAPIAETSKPMQSVAGSGASFDVTTPSDFFALSVKEEPIQPVQDFSGTTWQDLEAKRLSGETFGVDPSFVQKDLAAREQGAEREAFTFGINEDVAGYDKDYLSGDFADRINMSGQEQLKQNLDVGTEQRLGAMGLQRVYEQDKYKGYEYNPTTGEYDYYDNTPSMIDTAMPVIIKTAITAAVTAGLGGTLTSTLGVSNTTGAALASGAVSAAQGGDLEEVVTSALSAGFAEEVKGLQTAAEAVGATKEVIAFADTMKNIQTGIDLVKAVDSGDVLGAISSTLDLTGNGSPASYIKEALGTSDAQTAGILKVIDKQLQGESLDDSLKSGAATWVKEGGIKEIDLDIDFGNGDWETPEAIKVIGDKLVEGASWANENFIKPVVKTVEELGAGAIEAASQANQFVQREIIDEVQVLMSEQNETFQAAIEPIKEEFSQLNQSVRTDLANFDKEYLQPVKQEISVINENVRKELALFDDETLQPIKKDIEDVITKVDTTLSSFNQDYIKPIDEKLSQTNKDVRDQLANFDTEYLQPIKQDLSDTNKAFQEDIDNIQLALSEQNQSFREGLSGFEDEYLNPIKDDIETMAGNLKDGLSDTNKYVREQLAGFDDNVLQPIKDEIESVLDNIDGLDVDMSGVQDMLSGLWDAVTGLNTGLAATQEKFGQPSADKSALAKMRTRYGEQYQFEDLRNNPLLNNELFS